MNKEFGEYVKNLRERKTEFIDDQGRLRKFRQEDVAERSGGLTARMVSAIESGRFPDFGFYVKKLERLARGLMLTELEKQELFAKARLVYPTSQNRTDETFIRSMLLKLHHPVSVRTPLWDFIAFNEYHRVLWGYTDEEVALLSDTSDFGPNLIRVVFHKDFGERGRQRGVEFEEEALRAFRMSSLPYVNTGRYRQIIDCANQNRRFRILWEMQDDTDSFRDWNESRMIARVKHPEFKTMEFMSVRVAERYHTGNVDMWMYVPLADSEDKYRELRESVGLNRVYYFEPRSLK